MPASMIVLLAVYFVGMLVLGFVAACSMPRDVHHRTGWLTLAFLVGAMGACAVLL